MNGIMQRRIREIGTDCYVLLCWYEDTWHLELQHLERPEDILPYRGHSFPRNLPKGVRLWAITEPSFQRSDQIWLYFQYSDDLSDFIAGELDICLTKAVL